ncbi:MAG: hypothetical protein NVSMB19_23680 [Vulcanimicrobiaceae bacterium]
MTLRIVDGPEAIDIEEREREGLPRSKRPRHLAFQLDDTRAAQVRSGQTIETCIFSLRCRRVAIDRRRCTIGMGFAAVYCAGSSIDERRFAIRLCLNALGGSCTAIGNGNIAVRFRAAAFVGSRATILRRTATIGGRKPSSDGRIDPISCSSCCA